MDIHYMKENVKKISLKIVNKFILKIIFKNVDNVPMDL
jgi:hypothetical protein